jgi:hypothetical protein
MVSMESELLKWLASRGLTMEAVTEAFPQTQTPVRPGVYWVEFHTNGGDIGPYTSSGWCYWNGTFWGVTVARTWMAEAFSVKPGLFQAKAWRGLLNEAKG